MAIFHLYIIHLYMRFNYVKDIVMYIRSFWIGFECSYNPTILIVCKVADLNSWKSNSIYNISATLYIQCIISFIVLCKYLPLYVCIYYWLSHSLVWNNNMGIYLDWYKFVLLQTKGSFCFQWYLALLYHTYLLNFVLYMLMLSIFVDLNVW